MGNHDQRPQIDLNSIQNRLEWDKQEIYLDYRANHMKNRVVFRGQVYKCDLGIGIGAEQTKNRPCVIVSTNVAQSSGNTIVVPITHTCKDIPCIISITNKYDSNRNVILDGYANVSQVRTVSKARLGDYICDLSDDEMLLIDNAIAVQLGIKHHYDKLQRLYNDKLVYIDKLNRILDDIKEQVGVNSNREISDRLKELLDKNTNL